MSDNFRTITGRAHAFGHAIEQVTRLRKIRGAMVAFDRAPRYVSFGIRLADPTQLDRALKLGDELAYAAGTQVVIAQRQGGIIQFQFQLSQGYWRKYHRADLAAQPGLVPLGIGDGGRQVNFQFSPPHSGIFGATDSGKSETVKSLLVGLFVAFTPHELQTLIIDPDGDHVDNFRNVTHLWGMPIARTEEEADQALDYANGVMTQRAAANDREGRRLVVVIDEAEKVLADGRRMRIAQAIGKDGRKWRVNLILATQNPSEDTLPDLLPQVLNRHVGLVDKAQTSTHLTGHAGLACHKLSGFGDFYHVAGNLQERVLVALATAADFASLPRAELAAPEVIDVDPLDPDRLDGDPPDWYGGDDGGDGAGPGRPANEIEPERLAYYLLYRPQNVTQSQAREVLSLSKYTHLKYKRFAVACLREIERLMAARKGS